MTDKEQRIDNLLNILRKLIIECVKVAPRLEEIEKITEEKYPEIKKKPFWQTMSYEVSPDASNQLKATHLAVLAAQIKIEEIFGDLIIFREIEANYKNPFDKEIFGLCDSLRKLHEVQQAVEMQKYSLVK